MRKLTCGSAAESARCLSLVWERSTPDSFETSYGYSWCQANPRQQRRQSFAANDKRCWKEQRRELMDSNGIASVVRRGIGR